jgi:hypothetical protein
MLDGMGVDIGLDEVTYSDPLPSFEISNAVMRSQKPTGLWLRREHPCQKRE